MIAIMSPAQEGRAITRAEPADRDRLIDLMAKFYAEEGYGFGSGTTRALEELLADSTLGAVWVFREEETIVGYLVVTFGFSLEFHGRNAFVDELFILAEHRSRGLGAAGLAVAEEFCRSQGIAALRLEVERENPRGQALYEKKGYRAHPRSIMTKWLVGAAGAG
jgi:GNAT superfamily N-acetyltransferase